MRQLRMSSKLPIRPSSSSDGKVLRYATYPDVDEPSYDLVAQHYMVAQLELYRFARNAYPEDFGKLVAISTYHETIFGHTTISKRTMSRILLASLAYNPRRLKGATKELGNKVTACYLINHPLEIAYGIEWMLYIWFIKYKAEERKRQPIAEGSLPLLNTPEAVEAEFDFLATCSPQEWKDVLDEVPEIEEAMPRISWADIWKQIGWKPSEVKPLVDRVSTERPRKDDRRLSGFEVKK